MSINKLLQDYRIPFRQISPKWINICCPYDYNHKGGDTDYFLGIGVNGKSCSCWSCGSLNPTQVFSDLLGISHGEAYELLDGYNFGAEYTRMPKRQNAATMTIPGTKTPTKRHIDYIEGRGYDFEMLDEKYDLRYTDGLDENPWKVVLPIKLNNREVSFQARTILPNQKLRYRSAKPEESLVHYKDLIFGLDGWSSDVCGIVEGAFDKFRMGKGVGTSFGSALTNGQINFIAQRYKRVVFMFDPMDEKAWIKSGKHVNELNSMGVLAERIKWDGEDPDELGFEKCRMLKQEVGIK